MAGVAADRGARHACVLHSGAGTGPQQPCGARHFAMMLAPTRRTLVWPIYPPGVELIQNDMAAAEYESEVDTWTTRAPARPSS